MKIVQNGVGNSWEFLCVVSSSMKPTGIRAARPAKREQIIVIFCKMVNLMCRPLATKEDLEPLLDWNLLIVPLKM